MSAHATPQSATASQPSFLKKHHFLLRRLHSLSGILPVGVFVIMHLFTNFQMLVGDFQHEVEFIHSLPALIALEMTIWLSIAFHAGLGIVYTVQGNQSNVRHYGWAGNIRYSLQRVTGILALIFIFVHIATLRWRWEFFGFFTPFYVEAEDGTAIAAATTANALQYHWSILAIYVVGVLAVIYHWCNGLWTAAITWGVTVSVAAQRRWGAVCAALALALTVFGIGAIVGAMQYEMSPSEQAALQEMGVLPLEEAAEASDDAPPVSDPEATEP